MFERGAIVVAARAEDLKAAFKRAKKIDGYRWVAINREDLFVCEAPAWTLTPMAACST